MVVVIQVHLSDGTTVEQKIINFFARKISKEDATLVYNECINIGIECGTECFDRAVQRVCQILGLNEYELASDIESNMVEPELN
jgi:hypothetical protein